MDRKILQNQLNRRLSEIERELLHLKNEDPFADPEHTRDNASPDTDASEQNSHERIESLIDALEDEKIRILRTQDSIANDTYGICIICGKPIDAKRLKIMSTTRYCMHCKHDS